VRKLLVAFGIVAMAGPAFAHHGGMEKDRTNEVGESAGSDQSLNREGFKELKANPRTIRVRLDRSMGDQLGPNVDVHKICGARGAQKVDVRRSATDVLATVMTIGFYSPTHGYVLCN
jgi:hypothetical protein